MPPRVQVLKVQCAVCGKTMERRLKEVARNTSGRFFCSMVCRNVLGSKPRTHPDRLCEVCNKSFRQTSYPKTKTKGAGRFCSKACLNVWQARNAVHRRCVICGADFQLSPSAAKRAKGEFCSKACAGVARVKNGIGRFHNGREITTNRQGYALAYQPDHPGASRTSGRVLEHRLVAERILRRPLMSSEQVHHLNGLKTDNRPENLFVLSPSDHTAITLGEAGARRTASQRRIQELEAELTRYRERFGALT